MGLRLYCFGLYERKLGRKWKGFFRVDLAPVFGYSVKRFVRGGEPCFPCGVDTDANEQTRSRVGSRVGSVLSLRHARPSYIHLPHFTLCLLGAGPLFTRLGSGYRQYRPRIAPCSHHYGFGC